MRRRSRTATKPVQAPSKKAIRQPYSIMAAGLRDSVSICVNNSGRQGGSHKVWMKRGAFRRAGCEKLYEGWLRLKTRDIYASARGLYVAGAMMAAAAAQRHMEASVCSCRLMLGNRCATGKFNHTEACMPLLH